MPGRLMLLAAFALVAATPAVAQKAGELVSAEPMAGAPQQMQAWRIAYGTTDQDGRARTVTGVVVAPRRSGRDPSSPGLTAPGAWSNAAVLR